MAAGKRRRSISSLLIPSFLSLDTQRAAQTPSSTSSSTICSDYPLTEEPDTKPAEDLLDDDPFANLTGVTPSVVAKPPTSPPLPTVPASSSPVTSPPLATIAPPKSPLSPSLPLRSQVRPGFPRAKSHSNAGRAVPAYKKPAFVPRPSLPSLDTLAKMSVVVPVKVRKGKVGARLPSEPWNLPSCTPACSAPATPSLAPCDPPPSNPSSELESEFELCDHEDEDEDEEDLLLLESYASTPTESGSLELPSSNDEFYRRQSALLSVRSRTPSLSPERSGVAWPALSLATRTSTDSELSTPGFSESEDTSCESESVSPPTELEEFPSDTFGILGVDEDDILFGASAESIRTSLYNMGRARALSTSTAHFTGGSSTLEMKDATDRSQNTTGSFSAHQFSSSAISGSYRSGNHTQGGSSAGGHGRDDDEDKPFQSSLSSASSDAEEEGESEDEEERGRTLTAGWKAGSGPSSEDDIPLAQRLPQALSVQKVIRKQVREERDQRRKERALKRLQQQKSPLPPGSAPQLRVPRKSIETERPIVSRERHDTIRPAGAGLPAFPTTFPSIPQEAVPQGVAPSIKPRTRTQTLPGRPFAATELTKRLNDLQMAVPPQYPPAPESGASLSRRPTRGAPHPNNPVVPVPPVPASGKEVEAVSQLRHARSFHRSTRRGDDEGLPPSESSQGLVRSTTRSKGLARSKSTVRPSTADPGARPAELEPLPTGHLSRSNTRRVPTSETTVPELPSVKVPTTTHKIFIGDLQTFHVVEVAANTNAKDIIILLEERGTLKGWAGSGGWMMWEVCQDLGMERPIRTFELLSEISASWKDNMANYFVLKLTNFAPLLSRSNLPTSSPVFSGYLEYEYKRGKWAKRYLRLRENSLYLSKRDNGKDEQFLCSLSNFDAYLVKGNHKAPKPFAFAAKSTDSLSFFENTADYMHVFSCNQSDGDKWMERILLARSYVLFQERNVLFAAKPAAATSSTSTLQRSGTRKGPGGRLLAPAPLVDMSPNPLFEPGSLLHKHS